VLRPVRFMETHTIANLPVGGITTDGELVHRFAPDASVQLIAVDDIGKFVAMAFADPDEYLGEAIDLAGDALTPHETAALISQAIGRTITYRQVSGNESGLTPTALAAIVNPAVMWQADIADLRRRHPNLRDFRTWLAHGGAERITALLSSG
ncbi:MAG: NmrA family NAD(P)-binding protein, partial [Stackebrandtia sp.]